MDLRLITAIIIGKTINQLLRLKGSGGTAAPGLHALKIDPHLVKKLSIKIKNGSIIISGTNGKTTTARITSDILSAKNRVIHNRQGSNLLRGVASTLVKNCSLMGNLDFDWGIWEADEAALPEILSQTAPKTVVLLNLFRDQLDRYGEVETVRTKWSKAVSQLPPSAILILNVDDPNVSFVAKSFKGKPLYFGVEDKNLDLPTVENVADIRFCLNCGSKLAYNPIFSAHLGHWSCPKCHEHRHKPSVSASNLQFNSNLSSKLQLTMNHKPITVNYSLPGFYNVYNILAATSAALSSGVNTKQIVESIKSFQPAFGRFQKLKVKGKNAVVFLIKNPAGANEVIRTISSLQNTHLLAILNDNIADGRDVSWIWDTNWEVLKDKFKSTTTSGIRAYDMSLRLKYAGMNNINTHEDINNSLENSLRKLRTKDTLLILPTYTAMLELQKILGEKWHND